MDWACTGEGVEGTYYVNGSHRDQGGRVGPIRTYGDYFKDCKGHFKKIKSFFKNLKAVEYSPKTS